MRRFISNIRNKVEFERVKALKINDRKRHCIKPIQCRLRSLICLQLSRSSNSTLFLIFGIILFLLILTGCQEPWGKDSSHETQKVADMLRRRAMIVLSKEMGLEPFGTGGGMTNAKIRMLALGFRYRKGIRNIEEARGLLLRAVDRFVELINQDSENRVYLCEYPFSRRNIEIAVYLIDSQGNPVKPGDLSVIAAADNVFEYYIKSAQTNNLEAVCQEPYEEAKEKMLRAAEN